MDDEHIWHSQQLAKHCRVCGLRLQRAKARATTYSCMENREALQLSFGIEVEDDNDMVHPTQFCSSCYMKTKRTFKAITNGEPYDPDDSRFIWAPHSSSSCKICDHFGELATGGRGKRASKKRGRPSDRCASAISAVQGAQPPSFHPPGLPPSYKDIPSSLVCSICMSVLDRPVLLPCSELVCGSCCSQWVAVTGRVSCPCCHSSCMDRGDVRQPPPAVVELLGSLALSCTKCQQPVRAAQYLAHLKGHCKTHIITEAPSTLTVEQILAVPSTTPPTPLEKKTAGRILKRILNDNSTSVIKVPTSGQPLSLMPIVECRIPSSVACSKTLRSRSQQLERVREVVSGRNSREQLQDELKRTTKEDRETVLREAALPVKIPTNHSLALKSDLQLPWSKMRAIRRWLKKFQVHIASERKERMLASDIIGDNIEAEKGAFAFTNEDGTEEIREVPFVYVPNLVRKVADLLELNTRCGQLTWHDGSIPEEELWIKLGGDKGHGIFKFTVQLVNVTNPNSRANTCIIAMFTGSDNTTNLWTALQQYQEQIDELEGMKWGGKTIRLFLSGDYEFLTRMYGLSGASGRHCCLWCNITQADLKIPLHERGRLPSRTIQSMEEDYRHFADAGGNLKNAKFFNNSIGEPIFKIPVDKVCIPGLHISLGIFNRLFKLLEDACHELDLLQAERGQGEKHSGSSFERYSTALRRLSELQEMHQTMQQICKDGNEIIVHLTLNLPDAESNQQLACCREWVQEHRKKAEAVGREVEELKAQVAQKFNLKEGPFFLGLEKTLQQLNVQRQAYQGGTFVGNHVHKLLKPQNTETLCQSLLMVAQENGGHLVEQATQVATLFKTSFSHFAKCHNIYNAKTVTANDISELESNIKTFLQHYRTSFPKATILPKMHMLEDHVVPWMQQWHVASGLMGEQGGEQIHSHIASLLRTYSGVTDPVKRLAYIMKEHTLQTAPLLSTLQPPPSKRKKTTSSPGPCSPGP